MKIEQKGFIFTTFMKINLFFQDLPNAMSAAELTDKLGLHNLRSRQVISST